MNRVSVVCCWLLVLAGSLLLMGCNKSEAELATESDANGYFCRKCQAKFYTPEKVFAGSCAQCKEPAPVEVVGFTCDKDKYVTIVPRGPQMVKCGQCSEPVSGMKLPREKELIAWGATKQL